MICPWCGCVFCWDEGAEVSLAGSRKDYCSRSCKSHAKHWRIAVLACLNRGKLVFLTLADADEAAARANTRPRFAGRPLRPLPCAKAGHWHLTSNPGEHPLVRTIRAGRTRPAPCRPVRPDLILPEVFPLRRAQRAEMWV